MPTSLTLVKNKGMLFPATIDDQDKIRKLKEGQVIYVEFRKMRNYQFHKKWFALVNFSYEHWEPPPFIDFKHKNLTPVKNFELFRKDLIILAGFYEAYYRIDGSVRIEAKSISFAKMDESEFEKLYSATINAVLKHILINYIPKQLDAVVDQLLSFD